MRALIVVAVLLWSGPCLAASALCPEPLRVFVDRNFAPYSAYSAEEDALQGSDVLLMQRLATTLGCETDLTFMPWVRGLHALSTGALDILPFASFTEERAAYAYFTRPYRNESVGYLVRRGEVGSIDARIDGLGEDVRVGVQRGTQWGSVVDASIAPARAQGRVVEFTDIGAGIQMLLSGRIDAVLGEVGANLAAARDLGVDHRVTAHPNVLVRNPVHLMLSRRTFTPADARRVDRALGAVMQSAAYRALFGATALARPAQQEPPQPIE